MLTHNKTGQKTLRNVLALLLSFSLVASHQQVFAETKEQVIEQYRSKGYEAQQKGHFEDAFTYYTKAISLGLENAVVLNDLAVLCEQIHLPLKAEQYYLSAIQVDKNYLPPYMNLAYFYQRQGQSEKAFENFKKRFELRKGESDTWAQKAREELLQIHPEAIHWVLSLEAKSLSLEAERIVKEKQKQAQEELAGLVQRADQFYRNGQKLFNKSNYQEAIQEYDQALRLTPGNSRIFKARKKAVQEMMKEDVKRRSVKAVQMLDSGDPYSARNEFQKILTVIPNDPYLNSY